MKHFKYEFARGERELLEADCSFIGLCSAVGRLIQLIYGKFLRSNPNLADVLRQAMVMAVTDPESPIWAPDAHTVGSKCDIFVITPIRGDEA